MEPAAASFAAIGTTNQILATRPDALDAAVGIARSYLDALDSACSRFRPDFEVSMYVAAAASGPASFIGSPMLVDYLEAARFAARTGWRSGRFHRRLGRSTPAMTSTRAGTGTRSSGRAPWCGGRLAERHASGSRITTPAGVVLDFGATAKAYALDMIARLLALQLPGGFLVNLGGDLAAAGDVPDGGWRVGVEVADRTVRQVRSPIRRSRPRPPSCTWPTDTGGAHHIIDPRTGQTAVPAWSHVTCVAVTALAGEYRLHRSHRARRYRCLAEPTTAWPHAWNVRTARGLHHRPARTCQFGGRSDA